jgi:hypothetical protein
MATAFYAGAGQPTESDEKSAGWKRWWARVKQLALWLGAGGLLAFVFATDRFITSATATYHWAGLGQQDPAAIASDMSDEEVATLFSIRGEADNRDAVGVARGVTSQKLPEPSAAPKSVLIPIAATASQLPRARLPLAPTATRAVPVPKKKTRCKLHLRRRLTRSRHPTCFMTTRGCLT